MAEQDKSTQSPTATCRVFISYSHDSPEHQQRVLALANQLRKDGVEPGLICTSKTPMKAGLSGCAATSKRPTRSCSSLRKLISDGLRATKRKARVWAQLSRERLLPSRCTRAAGATGSSGRWSCGRKTRNSSRLSFACSTAIASIPLSIRSSPLTTAKSQAATRRINSQLTSIAYAIMRDSTRSGDMPVHGAESEVEEPWSAEQYATRSKAAHDKAQPIRED
jgi:hypothetical protein